MSRPEVQALLEGFRADLDAADTMQTLEEVRRKHVGKKSPVKTLLKTIRNIPPEDRPAFAAAVNQAQQAIEEALQHKTETVQQAQLAQQLDEEWLDLTMPGVAPRAGAVHPLTVVEDHCMAVLRRLGFVVEEGPEVESQYYNFDALNIPKHHPARDLQDTFYVNGNLVLRTHTTSVQARVLARKPELPIRVASYGRVYRNEAVDANHLAMFHQFEGIWVDEGLTFAHLKGVLSFIVRSLYGEDAEIRFKPKYYPYTEPSVGVDLKQTRIMDDGSTRTEWATILGAGMVHPKVFAEFGYDPEQVSGIAFGLGTTRMACAATKLPALRPMYEADLRLQQQLHRGNP